MTVCGNGRAKCSHGRGRGAAPHMVHVDLQGLTKQWGGGGERYMTATANVLSSTLALHPSPSPIRDGQTGHHKPIHIIRSLTVVTFISIIQISTTRP